MPFENAAQRFYVAGVDFLENDLASDDFLDTIQSRGNAEELPVTEESPRQPATSPYGNTKQIAEDILRDCCAAYEGFRGIALRC